MYGQRVCFAGFASLIGMLSASAVLVADDALDRTLEAIRAKHDLPALAVAVIVDGETVAAGAVGVRKAGGDVPVTIDDKFHIGSCTKAMTATLIAQLIEQGKLREDITLAEAFPELDDSMQTGFRAMTLAHLLSHRAGLANHSWPEGMSYSGVHRLPGTPREQRYAYVKKMLSQKPEATPGTKYIYSNAGYAVAGVIAERAMDKPWEALLREMIFQPLDMQSAGFGAMGAEGKVDQPWQHQLVGDKRVPIEPGPLSDNPPAIGPAGTVHCSIGDWAKFIQAHLAGARGKDTLVTAKRFKKLHAQPFGGDYALGWVVAERGWAGGKVLTHAGSNNQNYAVVWIAPLKNFAVLVTTNQGGDSAAHACDETAAAMIHQFRHQ